MGTLDQVMQLKNQGYGEQDIINNLQQQGISPKEITDSINQSNIKSAVSPGGTEAPPTPEMTTKPIGTEQGYYTPQTQEAKEGYSQQATAPAEYYEEEAYAPAVSGGMDSDTIIEIANQIFTEKIKKTEHRLEDLEELKIIAQVKVNSLDERLKRIEKMIDTLQIQILEKIGSYGRELESTKKEVSMLENTLGKTIKTKVEKKHTLKKPISRKKR